MWLAGTRELQGGRDGQPGEQAGGQHVCRPPSGILPQTAASCHLAGMFNCISVQPLVAAERVVFYRGALLCCISDACITRAG